MMSQFAGISFVIHQSLFNIPPMPALSSYTKPLTAAQAEKLRALIGDKGFRMDEKPHCLFAGAGEKVNIAVYAKGPKVVVQGKGTEDFVKFTLSRKSWAWRKWVTRKCYIPNGSRRTLVWMKAARVIFLGRWSLRGFMRICQ